MTISRSRPAGKTLPPDSFSSEAASEKPRLLSVENNAETRILLEHALDDSYAVTFASDEEEALDAVESGRFDALLLDINLTSEKGGIELLHTLREREETTGVPAIAVTAFAMPGDREDLFQEGFDAYVGKPFTLADLRETVRRAIGAES